MRKMLGICAALAWLAAPVLADMTPFQFTNVTTNNAVSAALGAQFRLEVSSVEGHTDQIAFTFVNPAGGAQSSIAQIYFYGGMTLDISSLTSSGAGVSFKPADSGFGHLPGLSPSVTSGMGFRVVEEADANSPASKNGINPGEWLKVLMQLGAGVTYADVVGAMNTLRAGTPYPELFVGIHVQGFSPGTSEGFITVPNGDGGGTVPVPAPGAALLGVVGLSLIGVVKRRLS